MVDWLINKGGKMPKKAYTLESLTNSVRLKYCSARELPSP